MHTTHAISHVYHTSLFCVCVVKINIKYILTGVYKQCKSKIYIQKSGCVRRDYLVSMCIIKYCTMTVSLKILRVVRRF